MLEILLLGDLSFNANENSKRDDFECFCVFMWEYCLYSWRVLEESGVFTWESIFFVNPIRIYFGKVFLRRFKGQ